jgi:hypothetical protein
MPRKGGRETDLERLRDALVSTLRLIGVRVADFPQ